MNETEMFDSLQIFLFGVSFGRAMIGKNVDHVFKRWYEDIIILKNRFHKNSYRIIEYIYEFTKKRIFTE